MHGIILEGYRQNLLPSESAFLDALKSVDAAVTHVSSTKAGPDGWIIPVGKGSTFEVRIPVTPRDLNTDFTGSVYAWVEPSQSGVSAALGIGKVDEKALSRSTLSDKPDRIVLPVRFSESVRSIEFLLRFENSGTSNVNVGIVLPCVEEGLFPSTPISLGSERATEVLQYQRKGNMFDDSEGTVSFLFEPSWNGHELTRGKSPHFLSCGDADGRNSVDIYADSNDGGLIKARIAANGISSNISSSVVPRKGTTHFVALRWAGGFADLFVDGFGGGAVPAAFPDSNRLGESFFVGTSSLDNRLSCFSVIAQLKGYKSWVPDDALRIEAYKQCPWRFDAFRHLERLQRYRPEHWPHDVVRPLLCFPRQWQETPPPWLLDGSSPSEGVFRDEIKRSLSVHLGNSYPEVPSGSGRTDLFVPDRGTEHPSIRLEFKIWGRNDYRDVPEKPLRYFAGNDYFGVVIMINPNRNKDIGSDYRANVRASATNIRDLFDLPFGQGGDIADHFVSVHQAERGVIAEILHIIVDLSGPFSDLGASKKSTGLAPAQ